MHEMPLLNEKKALFILYIYIYSEKEESSLLPEIVLDCYFSGLIELLDRIVRLEIC